MKSNILTLILGSTLFLGGFISFFGNHAGDYLSGLSAIFLLANINTAKA
jgi:hypothetical protein